MRDGVDGGNAEIKDRSLGKNGKKKIQIGLAAREHIIITLERENEKEKRIAGRAVGRAGGRTGGRAA